jgi:hypothetical protein
MMEKYEYGKLFKKMVVMEQRPKPIIEPGVRIT